MTGSRRSNKYRIAGPPRRARRFMKEVAVAAKFVIGKNAHNDEASKQPSSRNSWNTIKKKPAGGASFSTSMTLAFALIAMMMAFIFVVVLAVVWGRQFSSYTRQNMQSIADSTAASIAGAYEREGNKWTSDVVSLAGAAASISDDIGVQVLDADGGVLFDDTLTGAGATNVDATGIVLPQSVASRVPSGADAAVTSEIKDADGKKVGTLRLWAFGSDALLTTADAAFKTSSFQAIAIAAIIGVVLACVLGYVTSRKMAEPIQKITRTAKQLRNGDMTARTGVSGTDDIGQLGETFDDMASTLERDIKLEHRLTGDVAHELRTPLMAMQATVEAMQDGVLPADDEHFETVASEVRRLSRLVDAMLKLSRLENNANELKTERTDVIYLLRSLVSSQHALFHEKGLHLRFINESGREELMADVDGDLIREAMVNLMSNAMRYTDADGYVKVSVKQDRGDVLMSVEDTGIGIAKEDIPQTFSRFWRSDVSRERVSGGLGVGLSLTKEIVDKHNGTILVESELGRGTKFTLRIPRDQKRRNLAQAIQEG